MKFGLEDVRDALERASARQTAVTVAAGAVAKALLREIGVDVAGSVVDLEELAGRVDEARQGPGHRRRHRRGARTGRPAGPRLVRDARRTARRAARRRPDGHPGREGRRDR